MTKGRGSWKWVALVALAPLAGCGLHGKPKVDRPSKPAAHAASHGHATPTPTAPSEVPEPDAVVAPGIVEPWGGQADLAAQEPGWIAQIAVKEGEAVRAGQVLAVLEDGAQRHAVDLARAELAEAEAALARIDHGATAEELRQAEAEHAAAKARALLARSDAARTARLHEQRVVSDADAE
ncbi:MAG TPA: biotin/lipoyl-binding protein, partial [Anaeromyxobacter sp.]